MIPEDTQMSALKITAAGQILDGTTILAARISGTSPRELRDGDMRVDVTHVWHSHDLPAIVAALLSGDALPSGNHRRTRADGIPMVGYDR